MRYVTYRARYHTHDGPTEYGRLGRTICHRLYNICAYDHRTRHFVLRTPGWNQRPGLLTNRHELLSISRSL